MTYQVLARKWRPRAFNELIGQRHVVTALANSITNDKLHHAYLFTGTRGVGKTTVARIFAKALNCEQGPTVTPCLACAACQAIADGCYVDLIEVDAASRTRVEDTKELLDNVQYMPTQGRYKIYLIDEVHMLSGHSFNALLKTLEEPPSHVIFMLATTDPQKIPITVLSRCLQFVLKPLSACDIESYLSLILKDEGVEAEQKALALLSKAAAGSLRDSLSLLDQAIAYSQDCIRYQDVLSMLSTVDDLCIYRLLAAIAKDDSAEILALCRSMASDGVDFTQVLERFIEIFHEIATLQCVRHRENAEISATLVKFADHFSQEDIQLFYEICLNGCLTLSSVPLAQVGFEMTMLRLMSFKLTKPRLLMVESLQSAQVDMFVTEMSDLNQVPPAAKQSPMNMPISAKENQLTAELFHSAEKTVASPMASKERQCESPKTSLVLSGASVLSVAAREPDKKSPTEANEVHIDNSWVDLVESLPLAGMAKTVIMHCNLIEKTDRLVRLGIEDSFQAMLTSTAKQNIEVALRAYWQCEFKVSFEVLADKQQETPAMIKTRTYNENLKQAKAALTKDACFNEIVSRFDGQVDISTAKLTE